MIRNNLHLISLAAIILPLLAAPAAPAGVTFFTQREGSPDDDGFARFIESAGAVAEQDFESPDIGPYYASSSAIPVGDFELTLSSFLLDGTPFAAGLFDSVEFDVEGEIYSIAFFSATTLRITPEPDQRILACGAWIFDDLRTFDAAYLIQVTELDGSIWQAVLENEIEFNEYGHEIEGFFGAVSDVGIVELTITAIDPESGDPIADYFEIDHLWADADPLPPDVPDGLEQHKKPKLKQHPRFERHPGDWAHRHKGPKDFIPRDDVK